MLTLRGASGSGPGQAADQRPGHLPPVRNVAPGAVHGGGQGVQRVAQRRPGGLGRRPGRIETEPTTARWPCPAIARPAAMPMTSMPSARRGAHHAGSSTCVRPRAGTGPGAAAAARPGHPAAGSSVPGHSPRQPAVPCRTTGTLASRRPGPRPRHRRPGTAAWQEALLGHGRLGHAPSVPGAGRRRPRGGSCCSMPRRRTARSPDPETRRETGTMTATSRARHARCQPRAAAGTLIATVTPSTAADHRGHRQMATPPLHRAILNGGGQRVCAQRRGHRDRCRCPGRAASAGGPDPAGRWPGRRWPDRGGRGLAGSGRRSGG